MSCRKQRKNRQAIRDFNNRRLVLLPRVTSRNSASILSPYTAEDIEGLRKLWRVDNREVIMRGECSAPRHWPAQLMHVIKALLVSDDFREILVALDNEFLEVQTDWSEPRAVVMTYPELNCGATITFNRIWVGDIPVLEISAAFKESVA